MFETFDDAIIWQFSCAENILLADGDNGSKTYDAKETKKTHLKQSIISM